MSMIKPVLGSYQFSDFIMNLVASDLKNEDAVRRVRNGEGASISWIIGHLLDYRHQAMNLFGANKDPEYKATFCDAGANSGSNYPDIKGLLAKWNQLSPKFEEALQNVSDEQLTAQIKDEQSPHNEKTIMETLIFMMWHESYHMGALGIVRKELGYPATSDRAIAAVEASKL